MAKDIETLVGSDATDFQNLLNGYSEVWAASRALRSVGVSIEKFMAAGKPVAQATEEWLDYITAPGSGRWGYVPAKRYMVGGITARSLLGDLNIYAEPGAVFDFTGLSLSTARYLWRLTQFGVSINNLRIENAYNVFNCGNGTVANLPTTLVGPIPFFDLENVSVNNVHRVLFAFQKTSDQYLGRLRLRNFKVSNAWAGIYAGFGRIKEVDVDGFWARDIDGTPAGVATGEPVDPHGNYRALPTAASQALLIGCNNPLPADQIANTGWVIRNYDIRGVRDSRAGYVKPDNSDILNPEVHAIRLDGANAPKILSGHIEDVNSSGPYIVADCEGIYTKCIKTLIDDATLINAGRCEAAINFKGRNRTSADDSAASGTTSPSSFGYGQKATNIVITNTAYSTLAGGVTLAVEDCILENFYIEGCGGDQSASGSITSTTPNAVNRAYPVFVSPGLRNNVKVRHGTIKGALGSAAVGFYCWGLNNECYDLDIDGVVQTAISATNSDGAAIILNCNDGTGGENTAFAPLQVSVRDIRTKNIQKKGTGLTHVVLLTGPVPGASAPYMKDVEIINLKPADATDYGVALQTLTVTGLKLEDNDFSKVTTGSQRVGKRGSTVGTATGVYARNNKGWLEGVASSATDFSSAAINTFKQTTLTVVGLRDGDLCMGYQLNKPATVGLEIVSARYNAVDQAILTMANVTTTAIDQEAVTYACKAERVNGAI